MVAVEPGHVRFEELVHKAITRLKLRSQPSRDEEERRVRFRHRFFGHVRRVDDVIIPL